jgi:hypothetical protein
MSSHRGISRRLFLGGLGGVVVALPLLESMGPGGTKEARAATYDPFLVILRQGNGVQQQTDDEPERFWPSNPGALTTASMQADGDRATSVLSDYASKLTLVRGVNFAFDGNGCGHSGGGNQVLTAAQVSQDLSGAQSLAMGESIDNLVARQLTPNIEPLTLYAGPKYGYLDEVLSYRGPKQLRSAEQHPLKVYNDLFKLGTLDPKVLEELKARRQSVNDLVRSQLTSLLASPKLGGADRMRLEMHFQAIRDLEVNACKLPDMSLADMMALDANADSNDDVEAAAKMHIDVLALALSCGAVRAATLQIGSGNCGLQFFLAGEKQYSFHWISHRIQADGATGDPIPGADLKHHEIDKLHAGIFKYLLDKLASYTLGATSLLDAGASIWLNDLSDKYHGYRNVPHVIAGSCNGKLKTGQYLDLTPKVNNNKLWNTVGTAVSARSMGKDVLDDFGDPSLEPGLISQMLA